MKLLTMYLFLHPLLFFATTWLLIFLVIFILLSAHIFIFWLSNFLLKIPYTFSPRYVSHSFKPSYFFLFQTAFLSYKILKQTANKTKINDNCLWYYTTSYKTIKDTKIPLSELSESSEETWSVKKHQNRKKPSKLLLILSVILYCLQRFSYHNLLHSRCVHACTHHIQRKRANTEIKGFFLWVQRSSVWAYYVNPRSLV